MNKEIINYSFTYSARGYQAAISLTHLKCHIPTFIECKQKTLTSNI